MKKFNWATLKYAAIGFACLVIGTATVRALDLPEIGPVVVGAIMLSLLIASTNEPANRPKKA
jgi:voltage-gated potassium channel Kch